MKKVVLSGVNDRVGVRRKGKVGYTREESSDPVRLRALKVRRQENSEKR